MVVSCEDTTTNVKKKRSQKSQTCSDLFKGNSHLGT